MNPTSRHRSAIIASWVIFGIFLLLWLFPGLLNLIMSTKNYDLRIGLWASEWVGFSKFSAFWQSGDGSRAFANSFSLTLWGFLGAFVLGSAASYFVPRIRERKLRFFALALLLVPVFIPGVCWVTGVLPRIQANHASVRWRYMMMEILMLASVTGFAGAVFGMVMPGRGFFTGLSWTVVLLVFLCLSPDFNILHLLQSSDVRMDTMDAYAYRLGLLQGNYSSGAMIQQLKSLLQLLLGSVACIGVYIVFLRNRNSPFDSVVREQTSIPFSLWALPAAIFAIVIAILFAPTLYLHSFAGGLWEQLPMQLVSSALTFLIALVFSWAVIHVLRTMHIIWFTVCAGLLLAASNPLLGSVLFYTQLGWMRTVFPGVLTALFEPRCLLLLVLCARVSSASHLREQSIWWIALVPACLAAAHYWSDVLSPFLYLGNQKWIPFGSLLYMQQTSSLGADALTYFVNLLPCLGFLALSVFALSRYVDIERTPARALPPEHNKFSQDVVKNHHKYIGNQIGGGSLPPEELDGELVEEEREPE